MKSGLLRQPLGAHGTTWSYRDQYSLVRARARCQLRTGGWVGALNVCSRCVTKDVGAYSRSHRRSAVSASSCLSRGVPTLHP